MTEHTHIQCTTPGVNPTVNYGLWGIVLCQCRFISCNKCTALVRDVDNRQSYVSMGQGVYENAVLSAQFFWEPTTALKNKVYIKGEKMNGGLQRYLIIILLFSIFV